jgi:hypothetical protein
MGIGRLPAEGLQWWEPSELQWALIQADFRSFCASGSVEEDIICGVIQRSQSNTATKAPVAQYSITVLCHTNATSRMQRCAYPIRA